MDTHDYAGEFFKPKEEFRYEQRTTTEQYRNNYDRIFGKKDTVNGDTEENETDITIDPKPPIK